MYVFDGYFSAVEGDLHVIEQLRGEAVGFNVVDYAGGRDAVLG